MKEPDPLPPDNPFSPTLFGDLDGYGLRVMLLSPGVLVALAGVLVGSHTVVIVGAVIICLLAFIIQATIGRP